MASIALGIAGIASAIGGAAIGAHASSKASQAQVQAADAASQLQYSLGEDSLGFQKQVYQQQQANLQPWIQSGTTALGQLNAGTAAGGQFTKGFDQTFAAPTEDEVLNTPGVQLGLKMGEGALQNSAAASGGALSGGTLKNITQYATDYAGTQYQNAYNNKLQAYDTAFNVYNSNQSNAFNRLATLAGVGQTATAQLNAAGTNAANTYTGTNLSLGQSIGSNTIGAGNATASGYIGQANAYSGGLSSAFNSASLPFLLSQLGGGNLGVDWSNAGLDNAANSIGQ